MKLDIISPKVQTSRDCGKNTAKNNSLYYNRSAQCDSFTGNRQNARRTGKKVILYITQFSLLANLLSACGVKVPQNQQEPQAYVEQADNISNNGIEGEEPVVVVSENAAEYAEELQIDSDLLDAATRSKNLSEEVDFEALGAGTTQFPQYEESTNKGSYTVQFFKNDSGLVQVNYIKKATGGKEYDFTDKDGKVATLVDNIHGNQLTQAQKYAAEREVYDANRNTTGMVNIAYIASQAIKDMGMGYFDKESDLYNEAAEIYLRSLTAAHMLNINLDLVQNTGLDETATSFIREQFEDVVAPKIDADEYETYLTDVEQNDIPNEILEFTDFATAGKVYAPTIQTIDETSRKEQFSNLKANLAYSAYDNKGSKTGQYFTVEKDPETDLRTLKFNLEGICDKEVAGYVENIIANAYHLSDSDKNGNYTLRSLVGSAIRDEIAKAESNNEIFGNTDIGTLTTDNFISIVTNAAKEGKTIVVPKVDMSIQSNVELNETEARILLEKENNSINYAQLHITQESIPVADKEKFNGVDILEYVEYKDDETTLKEALQSSVSNEILESSKEAQDYYQSVLDEYKQASVSSNSIMTPANLYQSLYNTREELKNTEDYDSLTKEAKDEIKEKVDMLENLMIVSDKLFDENENLKNISALEYTVDIKDAETLKTLAASAIEQELGNDIILFDTFNSIKEVSPIKDSTVEKLLNFNVKEVLTANGYTVIRLEDANYTAAQAQVRNTYRRKVDPAPVDPTPVDPSPTDPSPRDPSPRDPSPTDPSPTDPSPRDPSPTDPSPRDPSPRDPSPRDPSPRDPSPVDPSPRDPSPVDPSPVDPSPVDPSPVDPSPVDPSPSDPCPEDPYPPTIDDPSDGGGGSGGGSGDAGDRGGGDDNCDSGDDGGGGSGGGGGAGGGGGESGDRDEFD